ncbi:MAG: DUF4215 domain-containing protein [bacterium]
MVQKIKNKIGKKAVIGSMIFLSFLCAYYFSGIISVVRADTFNRSISMNVYSPSGTFSDSGEKNDDGSPIYTYEVDPGAVITVTGTIEVTSALTDTPSLGIGSIFNGTPLGYFYQNSSNPSQTVQISNCTATGGINGGASSYTYPAYGARICERVFQGGNGTYQAVFTLQVDPNATRGAGPWRIGVSSKTGNILDEDFYIKIRQAPKCSIQAFSITPSSVQSGTSASVSFAFGTGGPFPWTLSVLSGGTYAPVTSGTDSSGQVSTGNLTYSPSNPTQTYRLTCTSPVNSESQDRVVTISQPPVVTTPPECTLTSGSTSVYTNQSVTFTGINGDGNFNWSAQGGNPSSKSTLNVGSDTFTTSFSTSGTYDRIKLTDGIGRQTQCPSITVSDPVVSTAGQCGSSNGQSFSTLSSSSAGLCALGVVTGFSGTGPWTWQCAGTNGGANASCSAVKTSNPPACTGTISANPNPIITSQPVGVTTISTNATCEYDLRVSSPSGTLAMMGGPGAGTYTSGAWVNNGTVFYLQKRGDTTSAGTLAQVTVNLQAPAPSGPVCGNGIQETGEQCDRGSANGACPSTCSISCRLNSCSAPASCGDGIVQSTEQCDNGAQNTNSCPVSSVSVQKCNTSCAIYYCLPTTGGSGGKSTLSITQFYLTDQNGNIKSTFNIGEKIYPYLAIINNSSYTTAFLPGGGPVFYNSIYGNKSGNIPKNTSSDINVYTSDSSMLAPHASRVYSLTSNHSLWSQDYWTVNTAGTYTARAYANSFVNLDTVDFNSQASTPYTVVGPTPPAPDLKLTAWADKAHTTVWWAPYVNTDGPVMLHYGYDYTLSWGAVSGATSCTLDGASVNVNGGSSIFTTNALTKTHTLSCTGAGGSGSDSLVVNTPPPPTNLVLSCPTPGTTLSATWSLPAGYSSSYFYESPTVAGVSTSVGTSQSFSTTPGQTYSVWVHSAYGANGASSSYILQNTTCVDPSASGSCITPTAGTVTAPTTAQTGTPIAVSCNYGVNNAYVTLNPSECTFVNWTGTGNTTANFSCAALSSAQTKTYTCTVANHTGFANLCSIPTPATASKTVAVSTAVVTPTLNLSATTPTSALPRTTTLTWTTTGSPTSCTASGGWSGAKSIAGGSETVTGFSTPTTFTLVCQNSAGSVTRQVTVTPIILTTYNLTVQPSYGGTVASDDGGISCGISCVKSYSNGTTVTLRAVPSSSAWKFVGWEGDCTRPTSGNVCAVSVTGAAKTAKALFSLDPLNYQEF